MRNPRIFDIAKGVPICGFNGGNGAGKTALAVNSAISDMANGATVYSTVPIASEFGQSRPIRGLRHLLDLENCTVLIDEIATIFSARGTNSLPAEAQTFLESLRHRSVTLRYTAPSWASTDVIIRRVTFACATVRPIVHKSEKGNPWPRTVVGAVGLLDTLGVPQDATPEKVLKRRFFRIRNLAAFGAYDTHAPVTMFGMRALHGTCPDCGGARSRPSCTPKRHAELDMPWVADSA